jgi:hypothetical protein
MNFGIASAADGWRSAGVVFWFDASSRPTSISVPSTEREYYHRPRSALGNMPPAEFAIKSTLEQAA